MVCMATSSEASEAPIFTTEVRQKVTHADLDPAEEGRAPTDHRHRK